MCRMKPPWRRDSFRRNLRSASSPVSCHHHPVNSSHHTSSSFILVLLLKYILVQFVSERNMIKMVAYSYQVTWNLGIQNSDPISLRTRQSYYKTREACDRRFCTNPNRKTLKMCLKNSCMLMNVPKASEKMVALLSPEFFSWIRVRMRFGFVSPTVGSPSVRKMMIGSRFFVANNMNVNFIIGLYV